MALLRAGLRDEVACAVADLVPLGGEAFDAELDGVAFFAESFLDAAQAVLQQAGFDVRRDESLLVLTQPRALDAPEAVATLLVQARHLIAVRITALSKNPSMFSGFFLHVLS